MAGGRATSRLGVARGARRWLPGRTPRANGPLAEARADADRVTHRLRLLGDVSELLSRTLDQGLGVAELARLVVPQLADWCIVTVAGTDGLERDLGWAHRDPQEQATLGDYARRQYTVMTPESAVATVLRTGEPVVVRQMPPDLLDAYVDDPAGRALLERLRPGSVAVLPLASGGRTLGAMALVTLSERGPHTDEELETAREVARRAGLALDNARLYGRQRHLAETLQRALLAEPPASDAVELAVRYLPAAEEAQVGGDWFDAFPQVDGGTVLVIGDVVGHDSRAAAEMGQLRGLLRGIGYTTGAGPAELLRRLDAAVEGLRIGTTATALVARVDRPSGEGARITWSDAGHPPAVLVTEEGSVEVLQHATADLMLGIDPATERTETVTALPPGATLLLYTDGLVERRDVPLDDGLAQLERVLSELGPRPLEELCDLVLERMLPGASPSRMTDDVALIAVRLR